MKIRSVGNFVLFLGGFCLLWGGSSRRLRAQNYPSHVTVFGQSSEGSNAPQQIDPAKEADIRQLMQTLQMKEMATRMMNSMTNDMRPLLLHSLPPGPYRERLVELFYQKFNSMLDAQKLLDMAVPIYAQNLSDDDIKGLIQFYQTPLGQRWLKVAPKIQTDLVPRAQSWGRSIGRQAMHDVLQEHPDLAKQLRAAAQARRQH